MANLIDTSYFFGSIAIAQIETLAVKQSVERYIAEHEALLLGSLIGDALYAGLLDVANANNANYIALKDGGNYMTGLGISKWNGLRYTINGIKKSLIANYIYCIYMQDNASATTGTGEKIDNAKKAIPVTPEYKIAKAWNEMVYLNRALYSFLTHSNYFQVYDLPYTRRLYSPINVLF